MRHSFVVHYVSGSTSSEWGIQSSRTLSDIIMFPSLFLVGKSRVSVKCYSLLQYSLVLRLHARMRLRQTYFSLCQS